MLAAQGSGEAVKMLLHDSREAFSILMQEGMQAFSRLLHDSREAFSVLMGVEGEGGTNQRPGTEHVTSGPMRSRRNCQKSVFLGDGTSERSGEHVLKSPMWKHCSIQHGGRIVQLGVYKYSEARQVNKGARVRLTEADICMNSKSEFYQPRTVRVNCGER